MLMDYKKKIYSLLGISFVACVTALILQRGGIAEYLFGFSISLFLVSILLLFFSETIFNSWKKFAQIYIPISIILVLLAPNFVNTGMGVVGYGFDKETTTWWLSGIFFVVSLIIIIRQSLKLRSVKQKK